MNDRLTSGSGGGSGCFVHVFHALQASGAQQQKSICPCVPPAYLLFAKNQRPCKDISPTPTHPPPCQHLQPELFLILIFFRYF